MEFLIEWMNKNPLCSCHSDGFGPFSNNTLRPVGPRGSKTECTPVSPRTTTRKTTLILTKIQSFYYQAGNNMISFVGKGNDPAHTMA